MGVVGVIQSFSDAIKLFVKEQFFPFRANKIIYYVSPIISLTIVLAIWVRFPKLDSMIRWEYRALFFFSCTSLSVYRLLGRGWSSNSNYSLIGSIRGVAQTVSYEVSLILIFITFLIFGAKFRFLNISHSLIIRLLIYIPLFFIWVISSLAETNRTPFDFSEGESELVSGFNIEYSRGGFALLFLGEYARIIFIRFLLGIIFIGQFRIFTFFLFCLLIVFSFIWVRSCYPRFRYDKLMRLSWKIFLPSSLIVIPYYALFF